MSSWGVTVFDTYSFGKAVKDLILAFAASLKAEHVSGLFVIGLVAFFVGFTIWLAVLTIRRKLAINWLANIVKSTKDLPDFFASRSRVDEQVEKGRKSGPQFRLKRAWQEYDETLVPDAKEGIIRNSVRPSIFFNTDDLHFGAGFFRIVPGLFVMVGLSLTFLGLIAALDQLGAVDEKSMSELLKIASAKFTMSLTGLACSILFTIALRIATNSVQASLSTLNHDIETRVRFQSLEELAMRQLKAVEEQQDHLRKLGYELVAELGRPLREELPQAISSSISAAISREMSPLLQTVSQMSSDGVGDMVKDLSSRFSDDVGAALSKASDRLAEAGDRIGGLVERMDQSSGRMGSEMEGAILRLGTALDELRTSMSSGAENTTSAFAKGADQLLAAMNDTLVGIRDNTGRGAEAIREAAAEMRLAAETIRSELQTAAEQGAEAARTRLAVAGDEVGSAIEGSGTRIMQAFGSTADQILKASDDLTQRANAGLLAPMEAISGRLSEALSGVEGSMSTLARANDGLKATSEASFQAADALRGSAQALASAAEPVRISVERADASSRQLADSTRHVADTVSASARQVAASAEQTLELATSILGSERAAIDSAMSGMQSIMRQMQGQGDRLDDLDTRLGAAFEVYRDKVEKTFEGLEGRVQQIVDRITPALDTMSDVVRQAEEFIPQSRRN